nr:ergosterol biosynthetic protein 28 [Quercus suber]
MLQGSARANDITGRCVHELYRRPRIAGQSSTLSYEHQNSNVAMSSNLQHVSSYLPPGDGLLPKWLSLPNSIQAYLSLAGTRQVYAGSSPSPTSSSSSSKNALPAGIPASTIRSDVASPVTELSARTFGTWTAISSIVRLYAAYHIHEPVVYELALWTFGIAWAHFASEWLVFGTARWGRGLAGPVFVATGTGAWMLAQWGSYVKA